MTPYNTNWGKTGGNKNSRKGTKKYWERYRKYKKPDAVYCQLCSQESTLEPVYILETNEILQVCNKCRE